MSLLGSLNCQRHALAIAPALFVVLPLDALGEGSVVTREGNSAAILSPKEGAMAVGTLPHCG